MLRVAHASGLLLLVVSCRIGFEAAPDGAPCTPQFERTAVQVGAQPRAGLIADFNGDGHDDLAATEGAAATSRVHIFLGNGDATFGPAQTLATGTNPWAIATGHLDTDGRLDLVVAAFTYESFDVFRNLGDGTFQPSGRYATAAGPQSVAISDLDLDGNEDIVVAEFTAATLSIFPGDGTGAPVAPPTVIPTTAGVYAVVAQDVTRDGRPDLLLARPDGLLGVLVNQAGGGFAPQVTYPTPAQPWSLDVADLDRDGDIDVAVAVNYDLAGEGVSVFLNAGDGTFAPSVFYPLGASMLGAAWWVDIGDLDGDGSPDVAVAGGYTNALWIFGNHGDGTLRPPFMVPTGSHVTCLALADLDDDGRVDMMSLDHDAGVAAIHRSTCH